MALHGVAIESMWRPDHRGIRHRRYLARCRCGWADAWVATRHEAGGRYDEHRAAAALASRMAKAGARAGADHPDPAA